MNALPHGWVPVLARLEADEISAQIALAQLLMADSEAAPAARLLELAGREPDNAALARLSRLAASHPEQIERVQALVASGLDPGEATGAEERLAATAAHFDRLAALAPEAGVAIYSLGDPELLAQATEELVALVAQWVPLDGAAVLDFGCGIGRVAAALAAHAGHVVGVDVSTRMIAEAKRRVVAPNVRFEKTDGSGLALLPDASFDLFLAVDSFPFLVRAGEKVVSGVLFEAARLVRPGGALLVFNWSYRGDVGTDAEDARRLGEQAGFRILRSGERPFRIWDGIGFHLVRK